MVMRKALHSVADGQRKKASVKRTTANSGFVNAEVWSVALYNLVHYPKICKRKLFIFIVRIQINIKDLN